jgi:hypothetical protein
MLATSPASLEESALVKLARTAAAVNGDVDGIMMEIITPGWAAHAVVPVEKMTSTVPNVSADNAVATAIGAAFHGMAVL